MNNVGYHIWKRPQIDAVLTFLIISSSDDSFEICSVGNGRHIHQRRERISPGEREREEELLEFSHFVFWALSYEIEIRISSDSKHFFKEGCFRRFFLSLILSSAKTYNFTETWSNSEILL